MYLLSINLAESDIDELLLLFSRERLQTYIDLTNSESSAIELHQETLNLGIELMRIIASIEIAIRNSVFNNLTNHFQVDNWLSQPPLPFNWKTMERRKITSAIDSAKRAKYSKITQAQKRDLDELAYPFGKPANEKYLDQSKKRRRQIHVTEGQVVAELTMYFWKRLFGPEYNHTLWRPTLKKVFPNKKIKRSEIALNLENIYQARNRIAHHEPVLYDRFHKTISSIEFILSNLNCSNILTKTPLEKLLSEEITTIKLTSTILHKKLDAFRA